MKRIDLANIPVKQQVIPLMKKNMARMNHPINSLGDYIEYTVTMHKQVLDHLEIMETTDEPHREDN